MPGVTVGLFPQDTRLYYVDLDFAVINNPYNGGKPVILMRHRGVPSKTQWQAINKILRQLHMRLVGKSEFREDGLWYHEVKEVSENGS